MRSGAGLFAAALTAATLHGQTPGLDGLPPGEVLRAAVRAVPADFTALASAPFQDGKATAFAAGGLLVLVAADRPLTRAWQNQVETRLDLPASGLWSSKSGVIRGADSWLVAAVPAWYLGALVADSSRGQTAAVLGAKAAAYAYLVSHVTLKTVFARERPWSDLDGGSAEPGTTDSPWRWGRFHRPYLNAETAGTAFPSFHFTLYAAVARVFHEVYGNAWLPYLAAGAGLAADLKGHRHWVSDMAAGTLLGLGIGHVVVQGFRGAAPRKVAGVALAVQPWTDLQGQSGLALRLAW